MNTSKENAGRSGPKKILNHSSCSSKNTCVAAHGLAHEAVGNRRKPSHATLEGPSSPLCLLKGAISQHVNTTSPRLPLPLNGTWWYRILRWPPRFLLPDINAQYNTLSLSVSKACKYDGISLSQWRTIIWQKGTLKMSLKSPVNWLGINPKGVTLGGSDLIQWALQGSQTFEAKRQSPIGLEGANCHVPDSATGQRMARSLYQQWMTPAKEQRAHSCNCRQLNSANNQGVSLEDNPDESIALANIFISASGSPEQRGSSYSMLMLTIWRNCEPTNDVILSHQIWVICYTAKENEYLPFHNRARWSSKLNSNGFFLSALKNLVKKSPQWMVLALGQSISNISNHLLRGILFQKSVSLIGHMISFKKSLSFCFGLVF